MTEEQDPHLLDDSGDDPVPAHDPVSVEFHGTIRRRTDESERAWQALLAVARLRPHTQRHPKLYERLEVSRDTLHKWRSQHSWNERLAGWNDVRAAEERRQIASQRHDAEVAVAGLARALAIKLGERIASMPTGDVTAHIVPQYVTALSRLMAIVDHDDEITDGLLDLGRLTGASDDGLDRLVDLAALDTELADRVLTAFGTRTGSDMRGTVADISISVELAEALDRLDGGFARRDYLATLHLLRLGVPMIANDGESGLSLGSLCRFVIASDPMFDDSPWVSRFADVLAGEPFLQRDPDDIVVGPLRREPVRDPDALQRIAPDSACRIGICGHRGHVGESGCRPRSTRSVPSTGWSWVTPDRLMEALCARHQFIADFERLNPARLMGLLWCLSWSRSRQLSGIVKSMLAMPPQHSKTTSGDMLAVWLFAVTGGRCRIITASHSESLALTRGTFVRQVIEAAPELGVRVAAEDRAKHRWRTADTHGVILGGLRSFGMSSRISGVPADVVIVDDAADGIAEAVGPNSEVIWERWTSVLQPRLQAHSMATILGTRWSESDLAGRLIESEPDAWSRVTIPALSTGSPDDPLGRAGHGIAAEPRRFTARQLEERRRVLGPLLFEAVFQQDPHALGGGLFDRSMWGSVDFDPADALIFVRAWDLAGGGADATAAILLAATGTGQLVIADILHERLDVAAVRRLLVDVSQSDRDTWGRYAAVTQVVEQQPGSSGKDQALTISELVPGVEFIAPTGSKEVHAYAASARQLDGELYISEAIPRSRVDALVRETEAFPGGRSDDLCDALAYAVNWALFHARPRRRATITSAAKLRIAG